MVLTHGTHTPMRFIKRLTDNFQNTFHILCNMRSPCIPNAENLRMFKAAKLSKDVNWRYEIGTAVSVCNFEVNKLFLAGSVILIMSYESFNYPLNCRRFSSFLLFTEQNFSAGPPREQLPRQINNE